VSKLLTSIGLMSGTSMDGIDVALLRTDGEGIVEPGPSATYPYDLGQRDLLRAAISAAKDVESREFLSTPLLRAEQMITDQHAKTVQVFLQKHSLTRSNIDVIGFHGQTVIHRPEMGLTVQLGSGDTLAKRLSIPVVFDLRAADVHAGGQGAPLVPVYHRCLSLKLAERPIVFVNIGGVANVTYIDNNNLLAFDAGPGNALIDDWMQKRTGQIRDENGTLALAGNVDETSVEQFLRHRYFAKKAPKSLDRNAFSDLSLTDLSVADGAATLVAMTVRAIARARDQMPKSPVQWVVCGGGRHNLAIMSSLHHLLPNVVTAEKCGFNGDSMEAEAWAYLAVRSLRGLPISFPGTTGVRQPLTGGVLAKP
jgi:anhydro-N-acetylmuramic acid kinase